MTNPIKAFQNTRKEHEVTLWSKWNDNGRQAEHLEPLIKAYEPLISQKVRQWNAPAVNKTAFKAELQKHLIKAFETYDPERGAAINTHVENRLVKAHRYRNRYQNVRYIPEGKSEKIGPLQRASDQLTEDFGRPPTHEELADHLEWPLKQVQTLYKAINRDVPASKPSSTGTATAQVNMQQLPRDQEVIQLLHYELNPEELKVFNHIYGRDGHKKMDSTNDLAKELNKSPSQISRIKTTIADKYKRFLLSGGSA